MIRRDGRTRTAWQIFAIPIAIALTGIGGLAAALLGNGVWDNFGAIAVAAPIAIVGWYLLRGVRNPN